MLNRKHLIVASIFLMGCSGLFEPDDYDISGIKTKANFVLPLTFGGITIEDIVGRQYSIPGIVVDNGTQIAIGSDRNIVLDDSVDLDLQDIENSEIVSGFLKVSTENEMPIEGLIQLYLLDANNQKIDSLVAFDKRAWIKSSTVDASGNLLTKGIFDENIELDKTKLDKLFDAKRLIIKTRLNTPKDANGNYPVVTFKSTYKLFNHYGINVVLKIEYDL